MENMMFSTSEAANTLGITWQAVYIAKKLGKLKGEKKGKRWFFHLKDIEEYRAFKHSRLKSVVDGKLVYDPALGNLSPNQCAALMQDDVQKIYYWLRAGHLKHVRVGSMYVININDLIDCKNRMYGIGLPSSES